MCPLNGMALTVHNIFTHIVFLRYFSQISAAQVPENDRCIQREKLRPNEPVYGNVTEANFDYLNQGVCGPRSDRASVWYEVRGRDARVTVKVCTNNEIITDYGIILECNTQKCLGAPPQTFEPANCDLGESVDYSWVAEKNVQYFVHVRSDVIDGVGSNFTIVYEDDSVDGTLPPGEPIVPGSGSDDDAVDAGRQNSVAGTVLLSTAASVAALFL